MSLNSGLEFAGDYDRLTHSGLILERRFNLSNFDPEAAQLHLEIRPSEKLQISVRQETRNIAGAIHAISQLEWIAKKLFGCQIRSLPVATHHAIAADIQIASLARGHRLKPRIQHVDLSVRDGLSNRDAVRVSGDPECRGPDRGFGWPVHVVHLAAEFLAQLTNQRRRECFASEKKFLQSSQGSQSIGIDRNHPRQGRRRLHVRDAVVPNLVRNRLRCPHRRE